MQKTNISFEYIKLIVMMNCERQFCQHRRNNLKATIDKNFDLVDYDILSDETENLFTYSIKNKVFSFSDVVTNQLLSTNIEKSKRIYLI